jgi:hypothetical protein
MIGGFSNPDSQQIIVGVKVSNTVAPDFEARADLLTIVSGDQLILSWNNSNALVLEMSPSLLPEGWATVEAAVGQDHLAIDLGAGGSGFYRVSLNP